MVDSDCVFCRIVAGDEDVDVVRETDEFLCFYDAYPVTEGHALVIPKQHVRYIENYDGNLGELFAFLDECHDEILELHDPDATNIGLNNGAAAGQTVPHLHWHIIPRRTGDMDDPEGGVRGVIPSEQKY